MSKFKRLSIDEAKEQFPLLNEEASKALKGGCSMCDELRKQYPNMRIYTEEEYDRMCADGTWTVGPVCGIGENVLGTVTVTPESYCNKHIWPLADEDCLYCYWDSMQYCGPHERYFKDLDGCPYCYIESPNDESYNYHNYSYSGASGGSTSDGSGDTGGNTGGTVGGGDSGGSGGTPPKPVTPVSLSWSSSVNQKAVSDQSKLVLQKLADLSGDHSLTISSTLRTPEQQASAMYDYIQTNGKGIAGAKSLYGNNGDLVIDVYDTYQKQSKDVILEEMTKKINELGPLNVSRHCGDDTTLKTLNVMDIAGSSVADAAAFERSLTQLKNDGEISKYIVEKRKDGSIICFHIEITQKTN